MGLGGRNRRAASASERARQSVTKTIKAVVERIAQSDAALGDIFSRCIKTGNFCSYQPDPDFPIAWEFAATDSDTTIEPDRAADTRVAIPLQHVPIIGRLRRWCWRFRRSRWRNEPHSWGGKLKAARFARPSIVR